MTTTAVRFASLFTAVALATSLAACGGGGGGGALPAPTPAPAPAPALAPVTVVSDSGALNLTVPASFYASGSMAASAFDSLNAARLASGAGELTQSTTLDVATQAHAAYMTAVQAQWSALTAAQQAEYQSPHDEYADIEPSAFYQTNVLTRALKAGALSNTGSAGEGIAGAQKIVNGAFVADGATCVQGLLYTVYHADDALSPSTSVAIAGWTDGIGEPGCVVDYITTDANGQVAPPNAPVVNPAPGATVPGTFAIAQELPRPAASQIRSSTAGTPVLFQGRTAAWLNAKATANANDQAFAPRVTSFSITAPNGSAVDAVILASAQFSGTNVVADSELREGTVVAIPRAPLSAGTYTVQATVTIGAGVTASRTWQFNAQ